METLEAQFRQVIYGSHHIEPIVIPLKEVARHVETLDVKFWQVICGSDHIEPNVISLEKDDESTSDGATASDIIISGICPLYEC